MTKDEEMPTFIALPDDNFGVFVENEIDRKKLLWLVNNIGEKKLRISANKRNKYYPDKLLFVSTILKRFNLVVPADIYTAVREPIYWIYILVLKDFSALKFGMTSDWSNRSYAFVKTAHYQKYFEEELISLFDIKLSFASKVESKRCALDIERNIKQKFNAFKVVSPYERGLINYGCGGHTEWLDFAVYDELISYLGNLGKQISLNDSLEWSRLKAPNILM